MKTSRTAKGSRRRSQDRMQRSFVSGRIPELCQIGSFTKSLWTTQSRFARVLHIASPAAAFSFLSGSGADQTGRSRLAFARYKGEAEKALLLAGFSYVYIFRPAYIYPVKPRKEPNFGYRLLRAIYPAFRIVFPNQVIRADDLARAMIDVAVHRTSEPGGQVLENRDIRALVEPFHR
jgi:uncharacterized protein YbjT (DUF2867 family)